MRTEAPARSKPGRKADNRSARASGPTRGPRALLIGTAAVGGLIVVALITLVALAASAQQTLDEAPEARKVLQAQANLPFQILIPAYLPAIFDRAGVEVKTQDGGPGGEPLVQLTYRARNGAVLFVREWIPVNPELEVLAKSRPIQTKWGKGWLLTQNQDLGAVWIDVGALRMSIYTHNLDVVSREQLLQIADTVGPASGRQAFTFYPERPIVRDVPPPPPVEATVNAEGVQEVTLVITPGGYSPLRFAVKKGVPVKLTFRQLGAVGCGSVLIFPADPRNPTSLALTGEKDRRELVFTPEEAGEFIFNCVENMYRGIMVVRE